MSIKTHLNKQSYKNISNLRSPISYNYTPQVPSHDQLTENRPIMILRVEDKFGVVHILKYYPQDSPRTVAKEFASSHGMDQRATDNLIRDIEDSLQRLGETDKIRTSSRVESSKQSQKGYNPIQKLDGKGTLSYKSLALTNDVVRQSAESYSTGQSYGFKKNTKPIELDTNPANNGEKQYIVGKKKQEKEK